MSARKAKSDAKSNELPRHESFLRHRGFVYLKLSVLIMLAVTIGYLVIDVQPVHNGGSWYGYLLGTVGALLIVWLSLLGIRKRSVSRHRWSLKAWTSAHVYLGLSLVVIGTLHTGFQFGWNVHTLAYGLMLVVIASGIFGIYMYANVPRMMSDNRASAGQMEMLDELSSMDRNIRAAASSLSEKYVHFVERATTDTRLAHSLAARFSGNDRRCSTARAITGMRKLAESDPQPPAALPDVMKMLEHKAAHLRRTRTHIRYRALLEVWLVVHVPATVALLAALTAHVISVFYYW